MSDSVVKYPIMKIQSDWYLRLWNLEGTGWLTCKYTANQEDSCIIRTISIDPDTIEYTFITNPNIFEVSSIGLETIHIIHLRTGHICSFKAIDWSYRNLHSSSVTALDVNTEGLAVSGSDTGEVHTWVTSHSVIRGRFYRHRGKITKCQFFPSGQKILTAGKDSQLLIWSTLTANLERKLVGHVSSVTDFDIVGTGRNIISVCSKLWNSERAQCLRNLINLKTAINCCTIGEYAPDSDESDAAKDLIEEYVENTFVILGCEDGKIISIKVNTHRRELSITGTSPVTAIATDNTSFIAGYRNGVIKMFDIASTACIKQFVDAASEILSILYYQDFGAFARKFDGTCTYYSSMYGEENEIHNLQLTSSYNGAVYDICTHGPSIYTACGDGIIRKYVMPSELDQHISITPFDSVSETINLGEEEAAV